MLISMDHNGVDTTWIISLREQEVLSIMDRISIIDMDPIILFGQHSSLLYDLEQFIWS